MTNRGFDRGCFGFSTSPAFEEVFDCESVMESTLGHFLGVSNVYWGMLFYAMLTVFNFLILSLKNTKQKIFRIIRLLLVVVGIIYSIFLTIYQYTWLQEFCALCLTSATIATLLFITSMIYWKFHSLKSQISNTQLTFFSSSLILFAFVAMGDILYFNSIEMKNTLTTTEDFDIETIQESQTQKTEGTNNTEQNSIRCGYSEDIPTLEKYLDLITDYDIKIGNSKSEIVIIEYFDPNCFHCKRLNSIMKNAIDKLKNDVYFVLKPNPLYSYSVKQIQALLIAQEEDLFFEMLDKQFALQQPRKGISLNQIKTIAIDLGMNESHLIERIQKGDYKKYIMDQRRIRRDNSITSMPTILINGQVVAKKSRTIECFDKLIQEIN